MPSAFKVFPIINVAILQKHDTVAVTLAVVDSSYVALTVAPFYGATFSMRLAGGIDRAGIYCC